MKVEIRNETAADVPEIEAVTISTFLNAPHLAAARGIFDVQHQGGGRTARQVRGGAGAEEMMDPRAKGVSACAAIRTLTVDEVNAAIRKYLDLQTMVQAEAGTLRER
jgi:hypothetical protein